MIQVLQLFFLCSEFFIPYLFFIFDFFLHKHEGGPISKRHTNSFFLINIHSWLKEKGLVVPINHSIGKEEKSGNICLQHFSIKPYFAFNYKTLPQQDEDAIVEGPYC